MSAALTAGMASPGDLWAEDSHARTLALALVASILLHALAVALLPGLRPAVPEREIPLTVEFAPLPEAEPAPSPPTPTPVAQPPTPPIQKRVQTPPAPRPEPLEQPVLRSEPEPRPQARPEPAPKPEPEPPPQVRVAPAVPPEPAPPPPVVASVQQPPPPPVPAPVTPVVDHAELGKAYRQQLHDAVERNKGPYPRLALMRRWEGSVEIRVQVGVDGKVSEVSVAHGSGYEVLDQRALDMVKAASAQVEVPRALHGTPTAVIVPVRFRLQS